MHTLTRQGCVSAVARWHRVWHALGTPTPCMRSLRPLPLAKADAELVPPDLTYGEQCSCCPVLPPSVW